MTAEDKACEGRAFEGKVCVVPGGPPLRNV